MLVPNAVGYSLLENKMLWVKPYLAIILLFSILNLPLSVVGTFIGHREFTTYTLLIPSFIIDIFFVVINIKRLRFSMFDALLILFILISLVIGIIHNLTFSRRLITDFTNPLFFILKIGIFKFFFQDADHQTFIAKYFRSGAFKLYVSAVISITLFLILARLRPMYAGLTPVTHPYFIFALLNKSLLGSVSVFVIVLLSGKRALILSTLVVFAAFKIYVQNSSKKLLYLLLPLFIFLGFLFFLNLDANNIGAFDKYLWTYETLKEADIEINLDDETGIIDKVTGGRLAEISSATKNMTTRDYWLGRGVGFTYTFSSEFDLYEDIPEYANIHFTPMSLVTKYGIPFTFFLILYMLGALKGFKYKGHLGIFFGLYLTGSMIDFMFAYTIFIDPFLPICIGFLKCKRQFV